MDRSEIHEQIFGRHVDEQAHRSVQAARDRRIAECLVWADRRPVSQVFEDRPIFKHVRDVEFLVVEGGHWLVSDSGLRFLHVQAPNIYVNVTTARDQARQAILQKQADLEEMQALDAWVGKTRESETFGTW